MKSLIFFGMLFIGFTMNSCDNNVVTPVQDSLSNEVIQDLQFVKEEEKLARDVYIYAYAKYGLSIFDNISQSEQKHIDAVGALLVQYNIADLSLAAEGEFSNTTLQTLYNNLTAQVDISIEKALFVGATIEDLDISDIDDMIANTDAADILNVYEKLTCGSKNHIRAFESQLTSYGETYVPQYISQDYYETILSETSGHCGN